MPIKKIVLFISIVLFLPIYAWAGCTETSPGVWEPDSLSLSDVQACVDSADGAADYSDGDTINLPSGSENWTSYLTIDKGISLIGVGADTNPKTQISRGDANFIRVTGTQGFRISGIYFYTTTKNSSGIIYVTDASGSASGSNGFRIDNNKFEPDGSSNDFSRAIHFATESTDGRLKGLVDNNYFKRSRILVQDTLQHFDGVHHSYDYPFGTNNAVYVEDNNFDNTPGSLSTSAKTCVDGDFGGQGYVARYNTSVNAYILAHHMQRRDSTDLRRGTAYWEVYGNELSETSDYLQWAFPIKLRAGTGFVFDNYTDNTNSFGTNVISLRTDSHTNSPREGNCDGTDDADGNDPNYSATAPGYPCRDQIGRGKDAFDWETYSNSPDQEKKPVYAWDNTTNGGTHLAVAVGGVEDNYIAQNRDYYDDEDSHMQTGTYSEMQAVSSPTSGDGFWVTDRGGDWCDDSSDNCPNGDSNDGALYVYNASLGDWEQYYIPYEYPHPLVSGSEPADDVDPEVFITTPTSSSTHDNGTDDDINLAGSASDNVEVDRVEWSNVASGAAGTCTGTTSWSETVGLVSGENLVTITAYDTSENSSTDQITITYTPVAVTEPIRGNNSSGAQMH